MNKLRRQKLSNIVDELQKQYELLVDVQAEEQEALDDTPESFEDKIDEMQATIDDLENIVINLDQVISDINDLI